jgi:hypothetical protein
VIPVAEAVLSVVCPDTRRLVAVEDASVLVPVTVRREIVVVARVEVPVTTKVLVVVLFVLVRLVINAVTAFSRVAKKLEDVALVSVALVA